MPDQATAHQGDPHAFRALTARVVAAERPGFLGDWTPEQRSLYAAGDWRGFSISRGYSQLEIDDFEAWLVALRAAIGGGRDPFEGVRDLLLRGALRNIAQDTRGELLHSSHSPFGPWDQPANADATAAGMAAIRDRSAEGSEVHALACQAVEAFARWRLTFGQ